MRVHDYTGKLQLANATIRHRSPRHFKEPKEGADYVCTNHPHIAEAYKAIGVPEYKETSKETEVFSKEAKSVEEPTIPEDFDTLNFFKQRSIVKSLTDEEVNTKEDVMRVVEQFRGN